MDTNFPIHLYTKLEKLGNGQFGVVSRWRLDDGQGEFNNLPNQIAVKKLTDKAKELTRGPVAGYQLLQDLKHDNLVEILGLPEIKGKPCVVMELCQANLKTLIEARTRLSVPDEVSCIVRQILQGLAFLHSKNIMHRDLKPDNILINCKDKGDFTDWASVDVEQISVKLTDYDFARMFSRRDPGEETVTLTIAGTFDYMAPEIKEAWMRRRNAAKYTESADIYSVGKIAYVLWRGTLEVAMLLFALKSFSTDFPEDDNVDELRSAAELAGSIFLDFLLSQLCLDKDARLTADALLQHPYLISPFETTLSTRASDSAALNNMLLEAIDKRDWVRAKRALKLGASADARDSQARSALFKVAWDGDAEILRMLLEAGADVNATNGKTDRTALHQSAQNGRLDLVHCLISIGEADVDLPNKFGRTPLHMACERGHLKVAALLVEVAKADIEARCKSGKSAEDLARKNGHQDVARFLLRHLRGSGHWRNVDEVA